MNEVEFTEQELEGIKKLFESRNNLKELWNYANPKLNGYMIGISDVDIDNRTITISVEYNDSCGCHPKYHTDEYPIPFYWLTDPLLAKQEIDKAKEQERLEAEEAKRVSEEKVQKAKAEQEYKQFLKLKEKFEAN